MPAIKAGKTLAFCVYYLAILPPPLILENKEVSGFFWLDL
jgi:hypothetical protein